MSAPSEHINVIHAPFAKCQSCGKEAELRPYGKDGAWICFPCGMKDEEESVRQFYKVLAQPGLTVIAKPTQ